MEKKVALVGCINHSKSFVDMVKAELRSLILSGDVEVEYFDIEGRFHGLNYDGIFVDELYKEMKAQEISGSEVVNLQPTNPYFAKESWKKKGRKK